MPLFTFKPPRYLPALLVAATLMACNDPSSTDPPYIVTPVATATLSGTPGWTLTDTLVVEVRDIEGNLVPGTKVKWSLPNGGRLAVQLADADDRMTGSTDDQGRNYAVWTLGLDEGTQVAKVAAGFGEPATFTASATVLHAKQVSAGGSYTCAVLTDDRPVCWGANHHGQLGTGDSLPRLTPTPVLGLPTVLEIRASPSFDDLTCARDLAGDVWCWGWNTSGQAGPAAAQPVQPTPVRVAGAEGAVSLSLGTSGNGFACAVLGAGGAACWGENWAGQLGTGDFVSSAAPRPVVGSSGFTSVASGWRRSCALDTDGEAWCWGDARGGELLPLPRAIYTTPVQPVPGHRYTSLAAGGNAVCGVQIAGIASCFGYDFVSFGHLPLTDLQPGDSPVRPDIAETIAQVAVDGFNGMYARSRYGRGYVWGAPGCCVAIPRMITPSLRIEDISAGEGQYCVISESGGVYCGRVNWWFFGGDESLAGIPDQVSP